MNKCIAACAPTQEETICRVLEKRIIAWGRKIIIYKQKSQDNVTQADAATKDKPDCKGEEKGHHDNRVYARDRSNDDAGKKPPNRPAGIPTLKARRADLRIPSLGTVRALLNPPPSPLMTAQAAIAATQIADHAGHSPSCWRTSMLLPHTPCGWSRPRSSPRSLAMRPAAKPAAAPIPVPAANRTFDHFQRTSSTGSTRGRSCLRKSVRQPRPSKPMRTPPSNPHVTAMVNGQLKAIIDVMTIVVTRAMHSAGRTTTRRLCSLLGKQSG